LAIAFIWLYHGLLPKLIFRHETEIELISKGPMLGTAEQTLWLAGIGEVLLGLCVLIFWNRRWPIFLSIAGFVTLLIASIAIAPEQTVHAFNPITLTVSAILFCLIQICEARRIPISPNENLEKG